MSIGGAQQVIRQLVENLDANFYEPEIVCLDNQLGEIGKLLTEKGIAVHLLNRKPGLDFTLIKNLSDLIKKHDYHIVHSHQYTPYLYALLAAFFRRSVRVIFTEHGRFYPDYGTLKRKALNPLLGMFTSQITAISQATKMALIQHENFSDRSIRVIYNGTADYSNARLDASALKQSFDIPRESLVLGTISRLEPIKNQKIMIKAFKQIKERFTNCHLLLVGDGDIRRELEQLAESLGLSKSITFTGFQSDPYRFHQIIDIFLLPSYSEGTSMTLLEAMSFSKPCVVTDVGGNPELVSHNVNGLVVTSDDLEEFANALLRLVESRELRQRMGEKGREIYVEKFTVQKMVSAFDQLYREKLIS
jgi:glycosyltransferase involved in cell wall biosynthesis